MYLFYTGLLAAIICRATPTMQPYELAASQRGSVLERDQGGYVWLGAHEASESGSNKKSTLDSFDKFIY